MNGNRPTSDILIIDDEVRVRTLFAEMLRDDGHGVRAAEDGPAALREIEHAPPDLILLDLLMPGLNGLDITRRLRTDERWRRIPVVIVTGTDDREKRIEALRLGADDFLVKPVLREELLARVHTLLEIKAYHDHLQRDKQDLEDVVARRTTELRRTMERLKKSSLDTIFRLSRAAEFRDEETGEHIQRMAHSCEAIAREMGLPESDIERLLYASPMHDIGKIGIPDRILLKPGKLDAREWETMQQHTLFGAGILADSDEELVQAAAEVALTHHEKWSGGGYPRGLRKEDIPLFGRISAIADVFDALLSERPYKKPFPLDQSLDIIREGRGTHFDPAVTDAFFAIQDELLQIRRQYCDRDFQSLSARQEADGGKAVSSHG